MSFRDNFTGSIDGSWVETDTGNDLTILDNRAYFDGGTGTWGDPGLRRGTVSRANANFAVLVRLTNSGNDGPAVALSPATNPAVPSANGHGIHFAYPDLWVSGVRVNPAEARLRSIDYLLGVIPRSGGGSFVFASGGIYGTFPTGTLLWVEQAGTDDPLYQLLWGRSGVWHADYAQVLDGADLPAVLLSRFGAATAADDYNRANGSLSGQNTPVGAKTYTTFGTPTITSNALVLDANDGAVVNAGVPGTAARIIEVAATTPAGTREIEVLFRGDGGLTNTLSFYCGNGESGIWNYATSSAIANTASVLSPASSSIRLVLYDFGTHVRCILQNLTLGTQSDVLGLVTTSTGNTRPYYGVRSTTGQHTVDDVAVWPSAITLPSGFGPFPTVPAGAGTALVTESFPGGDGSALPGQWTVHSGTWEQFGGKARMTASGVNGVATVQAGTTEHQLHAAITVPNTTPVYPIDWFVGVHGRYTDADNQVFARFLYQNNSPEVEVWEISAGVQTLIGYINLGGGELAPGSTHTLRLACLGAEVCAYFDGQPVVQATTTVLGGTRCGIGVRDSNPNGQPSWDDIAVTSTSGVDTTPPVLSAITATAITASGATITWTTNEAADRQVEYGTTLAYGSSTTLDPALLTSHSVPIAGLLANTLYNYRVKSRDAASNLATSGNFTFTTAAAGGAAPVISSIQAIQPTSTSFRAMWQTNVPSNSQVEHGPTAAYGSATALDTNMVTSHDVLVGGLTPDTDVHWRPRSDSG